MKKEYSLIFIVGLFILAYVLDAVVNPLTVDLATPYSYLNPEYFTKFPFTTASIVIKSLGLFLIPVWLFGFFEGHHMGKGAVALVLAGLMQLYALQEVATGAKLVPLEWSLSLSIAGAALLIPSVLYLIRGSFSSMGKSLTSEGYDENDHEEEEKTSKKSDKKESVLLP